MTSPVQQAPSLLAALRLRRFRAASLVLLACILLAQTLLVVHRIDHARAEHGAVCALCVAADHQAAPSHHAAVATSPLLPDFVPASIRALAAAPTLLSYHSRAPPTERHRS
jgi:hypothetical protein